MPAHRNLEENGSAAMLAAKGSAGVTPNVNLSECTSCTPPPSVNKTSYSGFETQQRCHQKSKTGVSLTHKKDLCPPTSKMYMKNLVYYGIPRGKCFSAHYGHIHVGQPEQLSCSFRLNKVYFMIFSQKKKFPSQVLINFFFFTQTLYF